MAADQVKSEGSGGPHISSSSPLKKLDKNGSRTKGSGSPFKCIGIGLAQQMKSERDEELATSRKRIEDLETLAASRQKEIFALNAKLAMSGSMTHDVLRDLLGIKLDMTTYSSLMDGHQMEEITEKTRIHNVDVNFKEEEVIKLKEQLNELVKERQGFLHSKEVHTGTLMQISHRFLPLADFRLVGQS